MVSIMLMAAVFSAFVTPNGSAAAMLPVVVLAARHAGQAAVPPADATPAHMIVIGPAGYRFGDYWKLGLGTTAGWFVVAITLIPVIWPT